MNGKHLFLTSAGLTDKMKEKFFDIIGKCPTFLQAVINAVFSCHTVKGFDIFICDL